MLRTLFRRIQADEQRDGALRQARRGEWLRLVDEPSSESEGEVGLRKVGGFGVCSNKIYRQKSKYLKRVSK